MYSVIIQKFLNKNLINNFHILFIILVYKYLSLVGISVVDHETSPLRHLTQVSPGVVEVLHRGQVSLCSQSEGELETRLISEDAGQDGDVSSLIEHLRTITIPCCHVAQDLSSVSIPQLLPAKNEEYKKRDRSVSKAQWL